MKKISRHDKQGKWLGCLKIYSPRFAVFKPKQFKPQWLSKKGKRMKQAIISFGRRWQLVQPEYRPTMPEFRSWRVLGTRYAGRKVILVHKTDTAPDTVLWYLWRRLSEERKAAGYRKWTIKRPHHKRKHLAKCARACCAAAAGIYWACEKHDKRRNCSWWMSIFNRRVVK